MMATTSFRDLILKRVPWWLRGALSSRILYAIGVQADALGDAVVEGVRRRFPGLDSDDSLELIGRDRRIARGHAEPASSYTPSLLRWLDDHAVRGGAYAMLRRLHDFYAGRTWEIQILNKSGGRYTMATDGTVTRDTHTWNPDDDLNWSRWWLFLHESPYPYVTDGEWSVLGTWDDGETWDAVDDTWDGVEVWFDAHIAWDDGGTWDTSLTEAEVEDLRVVPKNFDNTHATGTVVVLTGGLDLWDYPEGTWDEPPPSTWSDHGPLMLSV